MFYKHVYRREVLAQNIDLSLSNSYGRHWHVDGCIDVSIITCRPTRGTIISIGTLSMGGYIPVSPMVSYGQRHHHRVDVP